MKRKAVLFLIVFSFGIIITHPAFLPSHALNSYCTMCNGYLKSSEWFLQNGRVFSYLLFVIVNFVKLSYNSLGFVSAFFANVFLALSIVILYCELEEKVQFKNNMYNYLLFGLVFLIYYNPLYTGIFVFDEVMIISLGILFLTLSSVCLLKKKTNNYFLSLFFAALGVSCYQGIASYLFVTLFVLIVSNKDKFQDNKFYFYKILLCIFNYGVAFGINYIFIRLMNKVFNTSNIKIGSFNIVENFKLIFTKLMPSSFKCLFNFVNVKYYYLLSFIALVLLIYYIISNRNNKNNKNNILIVIMLLFSALVIPFVPNVFMSSLSNYTDARMTLTLGIIPALIILFILLSFKVNTNYFRVLVCLFVVAFGLTSYSIYRNMRINLKRYKYDLVYVSNVISLIDNYEKENDKKIKIIYYHEDTLFAHYYDLGLPNGVNVRLMGVPWSFECAVNTLNNNNNKILLKKMSEDKYNELFFNLDYDSFNKNQLIFEGNSLYLLIY